MKIRRLLPVPLVAVAAAAVLFAVSERRRAEERARITQELVASVRDEVDLARAEIAARDERITYLEGEVRARVEQMEALNRQVEVQRRELDEERRATNAKRERAFRPMPEGVRLAVRTLEELLRRDGYGDFRVLRAERLDQQQLQDVELLENDYELRRTIYYRAGALAVRLDRATGAATLVLTDGHTLTDEGLTPFPDGGLTIALPRVDGATWEARLPYLVTAENQYPVEDDGVPDDDRLDPIARADWQERVDALLLDAGTELNWRLARCQGLKDGWFLDVLVLGFGDGRLLERSAEAGSAAIEVDRSSGVVSLLLRDGILRRKGGNTTIPQSGYRIALPGVTAEQAIETMLGLVVDRSR